MDIEFDPAKDSLNREFHGLSLAAAASMFDYFRIDSEQESDDGETRYLSLGRISRKEIVVCVWTLRGEKARIISLRRAEKDEREIYHYHRP